MEQSLNLARKWRSRQFDEIVGQPLVVRLVKNSLYRNLIFPVYLLSGTRGCGKTSIARIFAASLNCEQLPAFQSSPQEHPLPCLMCMSCEAMQAMRHPDFIEVDAASHTGVDNVRQIIDAASFVPVLGKKKIYLIDEAHMLSKAAFNAFLKILEEPPASVVFMLATTDPHKIIETVTSRCFQLFFEPIKIPEVVKHLEFVCAQEALPCEVEALTLIAQETEGSMRDALNLVERLRIAYPQITKQAVIELLAIIDDDRLCELLEVVIQGNPQEILSACARLELTKYNPHVIWKKFVELIRLSLWVKHAVVPHEGTLPDRLKELIAQVSYQRLIALLEHCYSYELSFAKTAAPGTMLEMMLLTMGTQEGVMCSNRAQSDAQEGGNIRKRESTVSSERVQSDALEGGNIRKRESTVSSERVQGDALVQPVPRLAPADEGNEQVAERNEIVKSAQVDKIAPERPQATAIGSPWMRCLTEIEKMNDPLVISIFKQGTDEKYNAEARTLEITFPKDLVFFKDWLSNTQRIWQPILERFFVEGTQLVPHFTGVSTKERPVAVKQAVQQVARSVTQSATESVTQSVTEPDSGHVVTSQTLIESGAGQAGATRSTRSETAEKTAVKTAHTKVRTTTAQASSVQPGRFVPRSGGRGESGKVVTAVPESWEKSHMVMRVFPGTLMVSDVKFDKPSIADSTLQNGGTKGNATREGMGPMQGSIEDDQGMVPNQVGDTMGAKSLSLAGEAV